MKAKLTAKYTELKRIHKKWIMVLADIAILPISLWAAFSLRLGTLWPNTHISQFWWLFVAVIPTAILIFARLGLYRAIIRYIGSKALYAVLNGSVLMSFVVWSLVFISREPGFPRSIPIIFALVLMVLVGGSRLVVRWLYNWVNVNFASREPVVIYGAGDSGMQLVSSLQKGKEYLPVAFLDDNPQLWGHSVHGISVYCPESMDEIFKSMNIKRVLLAVPRATKKERKVILDKLEPFPVHVQTIPAMPDIVAGLATVDQLQEVELEDLLGRDPVPPKKELFEACIKNKVVMVTGAGGSIGSEICRQVIQANPNKLILFELNEFSLYAIERELLKEIAKSNLNIKLLPILGSVCNANRVEGVIAKYNVNTIYHAAAFKHVPLVEHNIFEGIRNNVVGTKTVAEAAHKLHVNHFVLISTDKAVRPTNVMGATKRLAEQVIQNLAQQSSTIFSMVRFGNVLGSSGSVVPLFRKQIAAGGPVTVTHPDITRFFMTIPEASQLVIQAGAMAKGGDVFVLDMGASVKILDLAHRMIELSGFEVKNDDNPEGDIAVEFTGLRPGEKLFEELLIGESVIGTEHPKILRANEIFVDISEIESSLSAFERAELSFDAKQARTVLEKVVSGFKPNSELVDLLQ
ncbi:nucleoside-diphosphate sugar epimerase/dehydratase [Reinekea marina]|uniref:Polysaccharide biosynthesis protein n=1 Tax=Reinekea marina TaxID=1310421 RepID=A0ABV7WRR1_9GAMM|nr:nucleoside-diphosphate sugar epimerase/dehydratase [Reinekea marina]MDN3649323.1 nucleoside-diphosphate sugar epimerase/dehydratase [Reinekea marina]